ncbi:zf-DNL-domain-containing protein, partial [Cutaneotrichosporon oleaginosum]
PEAEAEGGSTGKQPIGRVEPRLSLTFTCQAGPEKEQDVCGHRSSHEFSRKSYEKGVVIIQCPECKARHLIADHLGWFNEVTGDGQHKTVEELVKAKGEKVTRGRVNFDGDIEYAPE